MNERIFQDRIDGARAKVKRVAESEMKASRLGHARKAAEYADVRMGMEQILAIFLMPENPQDVSPREQIDDPTPGNDYIERIARSYANEMERDGEESECDPIRRMLPCLYPRDRCEGAIHSKDCPAYYWRDVYRAVKTYEDDRFAKPTDRNAGRDAALEQLVDAAKLTVLHFKRSQASGNFQGDDEHEAWSALTKALAAVEAAIKGGGE